MASCFSDQTFAGRSGDWFADLMLILKLTWLVPLPYVVINFYALIRYPVIAVPPVPESVPALKVQLYFRFVTRGRDPRLSVETANDARRVLEAVLPPDVWRIEVVSDNPLPVGSTDGRVRLIVVPADYRPPAGARFKARALHYALHESAATDDDWIIHLDEETRFDEETVRAIAHFVAGQAHRPQAQRRLGQGVVLYGRHRVVNWMTTLADSLRVGDDYGRFRLQYENGSSLLWHARFLCGS